MMMRRNFLLHDCTRMSAAVSLDLCIVTGAATTKSEQPSDSC